MVSLCGTAPPSQRINWIRAWWGELTCDVFEEQPLLDDFAHFGLIARQLKDAQVIRKRAKTHAAPISYYYST
jgi:hypothetical protein